MATSYFHVKLITFIQSVGYICYFQPGEILQKHEMR